MPEPTSFRTSLDRDFLAIWLRARNEPSLESLTVEQVRTWAEQRQLDVKNCEKTEVGIFCKTPAIVLTVDQGTKACFPTISETGDHEWQSRQSVTNNQALLWEKVEWFSPLWIPLGRVNKILQDIEPCSQERAIELFNYHTSTLYTLPFQAICISQILPQAHSLQEFVPLVREAYLAFYSGYRASSISALIPVIEGSLIRIARNMSPDIPISATINKVIDGAIETAADLHFGSIWIPREYRSKAYLFVNDERVFTFETFRKWLHQSFFRKTGEYNGATWLNRHVFAHSADVRWQQSANFSRLVVALATLALIESWHDRTHKVSLLEPDMDDDSKLIWQQALLRLQSQGIMKRVEQNYYHKHGRLVPEMPTDNGALLRKAVLEEDCINDLVRPMRNAGWNVEVSESDDEALFMIVTARSGAEQIKIALLYSCATENKLYRLLSETSHAILYRGAPYHQDSFANGVSVHVGPVAGWLPPKPAGSDALL